MTTPQQPSGNSAESASGRQSTTGSPLGIADQVAQLMTLPQNLCKQRGCCCRAVTFKGSRSIAEIDELAKEDSNDGEHARNFRSIFDPYKNQTSVPEEFQGFVTRVREAAQGKGKEPDAVGIFRCKFVLADGRCGVHEDRPTGCRAYPSAYKDTIFHPGCGFEDTARANWAKIETLIQDNFGISAETLLKGEK